MIGDPDFFLLQGYGFFELVGALDDSVVLVLFALKLLDAVGGQLTVDEYAAEGSKRASEECDERYNYFCGYFKSPPSSMPPVSWGPQYRQFPAFAFAGRQARRRG